MATMKRVGKWFARIAFALVGLVVLWLGLAAVYGRYAAARDRSLYPPLGVLVDIGGRKIHMYCVGHGAPTVVLEAALGAPTVLWKQMQPRLSRVTRTCSYDRDGIGWSDESNRPRSAQGFSNDLHRALLAAKEHGPFVIAAHSLGGMLALDFARAYPDDVAGMVLLDPTHPRQFTTGSEQWADHMQALPFFRLGPALAALGLAREALWATDKLKPLPLPLETRMEYVALGSSSKELGALKAEAEALFALCKESLPFPSLGSKPLIVLSASRSLAEGFPSAFHEQLARLSDRGVHRVVPNASHSGLVLKPEPAAIAVDAILEVVTALRQSGK